MNTPESQTLFDKLWASHRVARMNDGAEESCDLIYIDRIFLHERTGSVALKNLTERGRKVKDPARVFCTMDHIIDTFPGRGDETLMPSGGEFIRQTRAASKAANIRLFDIDDPLQGISHVIAPELGIVLPGLSSVCPDSHTCSLGALGALAIGIGSSEAEHALATNTLQLYKPRCMRIVCDGELQAGVTAKDLALYLIARFGSQGAEGCAVEYAGSAIDALTLEARFTLCNLAAEFGAFTALIAPDEKTVNAISATQYAPQGEQFAQAREYWQGLRSDENAEFDVQHRIDANEVPAMISWGTSPQHSVAINAAIPQAEHILHDPGMAKALQYQGLQAGDQLLGLSIDAAFIGSCTNARLSDLRLAASVITQGKVAQGNGAQGKVVQGKVAQNVAAVVVPGSKSVKRAAEAEGLDQIFLQAGFEWREPGCSMCFYAGGETFGAGKRVVSTTNRNFEGRQGPGTRTHLANPAVVAASALAGCIATPQGLHNAAV